MDATVTLRIQAQESNVETLSFYVQPLETFEITDEVGTPLPTTLETSWGSTFATITLPRALSVGEEYLLRFRIAGRAPCEPDPFFGMVTCTVSPEIVFFAFMDWLPTKAAWTYEDFYDTGPVDFEILTPKGLRAIATSEFVEALDLGDRMLHRFKGRFKDAYPAFAYGRFDVFSAVTADGKPVRSYVHTGTREFGAAWAEISADIINFYHGAIAPYLYGKHDVVQAIEELGGGVGPQSATFYVASALTTDPAEFHSEQLFAHEIAHSWWGGMVRSKDPYSPWLSEAFAEYSSRIYGYTRWPKESQDRVYSYSFDLFADFVPPEREVPLTSEGIYSTDATTYFFVTYIKGSHVLRMLEWLLGEEAFMKGLATYAQAHTWDKGGSLVTPDVFQQALEQASGKDIQPFFEQWVYGTGYPIYTWAAEFGRDGERHTVRLRVEQVQAQDTTFDLPLEVVVEAVNAEPLTLRLPVQARVVEETIFLDTQPLTVRINPSAWAFADTLPALRGDANGSNDIDGPDLVMAAWALGGTKSYDQDAPYYVKAADFNRDGKNDEEDLRIVLDGFGTQGRLP